MKNSAIFFLIIIFLAFMLRFFSLATIPPGIHGDEAEWGIIEQKVNRGEYSNFFSLGNTGQYFDFSILSYFVQGLSLRIFGPTVFGIRASSAFAGILTVLVFYFLAKRFFKHKITIILTTLALATSHWHIAYSRLALLNIWTPLFMVCIMYFYMRGLSTRKWQDFLLAGGLLGLSLYFHHTVKVIPLILIGFILVSLIIHAKQRSRFTLQCISAAFLAGMIFLPQAVYYLTHPGTFSPRLNEVSLFNHLAEYYARYHVYNIPGVLFWQFINTIKVFDFGGDIGFYFYGYQGGLLTPIVGVFALIGFIIACINFRKENNSFLLIWFFTVVVLGGVITIDAPSSQRILGVIPVLFLLAGLAVDRMIDMKIRYLQIIFVLLFLINGVWDYKIYFQDYIHSQAGWAQREPATQIAYYLKSLGPDWKVYMLRENTWLYFQHGTIRFLNPNLEGVDVENSESVIPIPGVTKKNIVYIMPPNSPSLKRIIKIYPKARIRYFFNPIGNTPSFISSEINNSELFL